MNTEAEQRFDYPVQVGMLPISENLKYKLHHLIAWFDTCIDWEDPPGPSPWSPVEADRFAEASDQALSALRRELGAAFEVNRRADEQRPLTAHTKSAP